MGGVRLVLVLAMVGLGCGDDSGGTPPDAPVGGDGGGQVTARIVAHPDVAYLPTQLDGSGSTDSRGRTLSYSWHFRSVPMGSSVADAAFVASGSGASFVSDRGGTYTVELTVRTPDGDSATATTDVVVPTIAMFHYGMSATADTSRLAPGLVRSDGTGDQLIACGETLDAGTARWDAGPSDMMTRLFLSAFFRAVDFYAPDPIAQPQATHRMVWFERSSGQLLVADEQGACPGAAPVRIDDPAATLPAQYVRFSPDGTRVAYVEVEPAGGPSRVITVGIDGTNRRVIRANPDGDAQPARVPPVWRDSQRLTWVEANPNLQNDLAVMQAIDSSDFPSVISLLTCVGNFAQIDEIGFPATGELLLSAQPSTSGATFDLYREAIGGTCDTARKLTAEPAYSKAADFAIAPDGMRIAYWSAAGEAQAAPMQRQVGDIWLVPADGSAQPRKLVGAMGLNDYQPRWVAGGRQLSWTRIPTGAGVPDAGAPPVGLLIASADGTGERVLVADSAVQGNVQLFLGSSNGGNACSGLPGALVGVEWLLGAALWVLIIVRGRSRRASQRGRK